MIARQFPARAATDPAHRPTGTLGRHIANARDGAAPMSDIEVPLRLRRQKRQAVAARVRLLRIVIKARTIAASARLPQLDLEGCRR